MKKGFTLVELLVVVLIIGILTSIALPHYEKAVWESRTSQLYTSVKALAEAQDVFYSANGKYANRFSSLFLQFDGLKKSKTSLTGRGISSEDAVRYNDFFELSINNRKGSFSFSTGLFTTGPYKHCGITYAQLDTTNKMTKKLYCLEDTSIKPAGKFCQEVLACEKLATTAYSARFYELP
jgi:prepilin-type N-terminal cleavage/methylation domain-containing protein